MIEIYTDGACSVNTGMGGWGVVVVENDNVIATESGHAEDTTNNRMELTAFLKALQYCETYTERQEFTIFTDSAYIANCFAQKWYQRWMANGWRTSNRMPVKNEDLWKAILKIHRQSEHCIIIAKVAGHTDNHYNNMADSIAVEAKTSQVGE